MVALLLGNTKLSRNLMHNTTQHTSLRATLRLQLCTLCDQFSVAALSANSFPKHKANLATQNVVSLPHHTHLRHILTVSFLFGNSARRSQYYKRYIRLHRVYQGCSKYSFPFRDRYLQSTTRMRREHTAPPISP